MRKKNFVLIIVASLVVLIGISTFRTQNKDVPLSKSEQHKDSPSTQPEKATFDKDKHSIDEPTSIWVIANKSRSLKPLDYAPNDLVAVGGGQFMRRSAATALQEMITAAAAEGLRLQPMSGYRSYGTQQSVYANEVATYGQEVADRQSARPGHSEHQTGLSIDVGGGGCGIEDCFGNTAEGKWVASNGHTYGFIIRYPSGKESITGYRYEPWHIRYVGKELAAEMKRTNTSTLEEFFDMQT